MYTKSLESFACTVQCLDGMFELQNSKNVIFRLCCVLLKITLSVTVLQFWVITNAYLRYISRKN
jgi:hypothetical protein